jgi:Secreted repeat of unknown function
MRPTRASSQPEFHEYVTRGILYLRSTCDRPCGVDYDLRAPAGVAIVVRRGSAEVEVKGKSGDVMLATLAGSLLVDVERAPQRVDVETGVGQRRGQAAARRLRRSCQYGGHASRRSHPVTYRGGPLYTFYLDRKRGDVGGEGFQDVGVWHAVTPGGLARVSSSSRWVRLRPGPRALRPSAP